MLVKAVFLGLVLTSLVLALPTTREENRDRVEINELDAKNDNRRELNRDEQRRRSSNEELDRMEEERKNERRETEKKDEERRGADKEKEERRRGADKEEERREADKEERRREAEKKDEERRGADKKDEERRGADKKEEERREAEKKDDERRGADKKDDERRETDKKEEERRRDADKKEDKRREKEERKEDKRREEERKEERKEQKRREKEDRKEDRRRGTDEMKKDEERREADKKDEERRGADKKDEERRRDTDKKDEERRGADKKDDERRGVDKKDEERRGSDKKDDERRGSDKKDDERRGANKNTDREKRRPTPAIKEEKRDSSLEKDDSPVNEDKLSAEEKRELNERMEKKAREIESRLADKIKKMTQEKEEKRDRRDTATKAGGQLSICESVTDFKYFQKIENEPTKYIQCDPWGTGKVKTCPDGLLWNEWTLVCDAKEHIRNMTLDLSKFSITTASRPIVNCSLVGMECLNGGSCVQATSGDYKCACRTDYTGQFCESRVDLTDITHEILNSTFSVVDYRKHLELENLTMSIAYYEKFKDQLDNLTYTELMRYLSFYKDGEVRYDTLVNSLVEDILENIYPDAEYLSVFNATEQNVIAMVQMIPSLLSYSRYSFDRYQDVFAQYQHVLTTLVKALNVSLPNIKQEATQYTVLTRIFLNQTVSLMNSIQDSSLIENTPVDQPIQLTEADIKKALEHNYNETLKAAEKLVLILSDFQNSVVTELQTNPSGVINLTLGEAKLKGAPEMLAVLNQVSVASAHIWESLVNYGFWYLTNLFSSVDTQKVESIGKTALKLNKF